MNYIWPFGSQTVPVLPTVLRTLTFKIVQRIFFIPCSKYQLEQDDTHKKKKNPEPRMEVPAGVSFSIRAQEAPLKKNGNVLQERDLPPTSYLS